MRTEFPNLAIVAITLRYFLKPIIPTLEANCPSSQSQLETAREYARAKGNEEVVLMLDYIERQKLVETFFRGAK